jgi:mannose-6-phosphate isomerase-like protein (cupin superfamily)
MKGQGYIYRRKSESPVVTSKCGASTRVFTADDTPVANLRVTHITDSVRHYHKACTEYYYVLEGRGKMELNDEVVDLEPGVAILIEPGTFHRAYGDITTIVFGVPAWHHTDEFYQTEPAAETHEAEDKR